MNNLPVMFNENYYHGSMEYLSPGTVLTPRQDYTERWGNTNFYDILEKYRPKKYIAHKDAVFMVKDIDDIDLAGGGTEYIFTVIPNGRVERHDVNWSSEISFLMDEYTSAYENDRDVASITTKIEDAAINYWSGVEHDSGESVWEYLCKSAVIKSVKAY